MIEAIIFDLGDVFLNLNHQASVDAFKKLGLNDWNEELKTKSILFETGKIDEYEFMLAIQKYIPNANLEDIREAWNAIIVDFPLERLEFLEKLKNKYKLYLLSNTNQTHIDKFEHRVGLTFAREFYAHFDKIHEDRLKVIIEEFGYPDANLIGNPDFVEDDSPLTISALIMHIKDIDYWKPIFLDLIKRGKAPANIYGNLVDSLQRGKSHFIYGIYQNVTPDKIIDFDKIDERRIAVGLSTWDLREKMNEIMKKKFGW